MANQIMKKSTGASDKMYPIFSMSMSWLRAVLLCCHIFSSLRRFLQERRAEVKAANQRRQLRLISVWQERLAV
jgi:hypothetical protein